MNLFFIGIGGALGSIARYKLGLLISKRKNKFFPISISIINITGAIFLGFTSNFNINQNLYLLLTEGFLGAYTTFSTFMYEGFYLFKENKKINPIIYILISIILGIIGYYFGFILANL